MNNPLISICIPVYNGEKYLIECINSCLSQTYKNFEIIICDDYSNDSSDRIIEEFKGKAPIIKYYKNDCNLGLVANWNRCIEKANGEWIKFVFQDDYITNDCLEKFVNEINDNTQLIVCKRHFVLDKEADPEEIEYYKNGVRTLENTGYYKTKYFGPAVISKIAINNIYMNFIGEPSLTLIKKDAFVKFGTFDKDLKQICDLEFLLRVASNTGLVYLPEQLCAFRIHTNSTTEKNLKVINYRQYYIEVLLYALKLLTKKEFEKFRNSLNLFESYKLKFFIKYKSYLAAKANVDDTTDADFRFVYKNYSKFFYTAFEVPLLKMLMYLKS